MEPFSVRPDKARALGNVMNTNSGKSRMVQVNSTVTELNSTVTYDGLEWPNFELATESSIYDTIAWITLRSYSGEYGDLATIYVGAENIKWGHVKNATMELLLDDEVVFTGVTRDIGNFVASIDPGDPGAHTLSARVVQSSRWNSSTSNTLTITVGKKVATLTIHGDETAQYGETGNLWFECKYNNAIIDGDYQVYIDNVLRDTYTDSDGEINIPLNGLSVGSHTITVVRLADDDYGEARATTSVFISQIPIIANFSLTQNGQELSYDDDGVYYADIDYPLVFTWTCPDMNGVPVNDAQFEVYDKMTKLATLNEGVYTYSVTNIDNGRDYVFRLMTSSNSNYTLYNEEMDYSVWGIEYINTSTDLSFSASQVKRNATATATATVINTKNNSRIQGLTVELHSTGRTEYGNQPGKIYDNVIATGTTNSNGQVVFTLPTKDEYSTVYYAEVIQTDRSIITSHSTYTIGSTYEIWNFKVEDNVVELQLIPDTTLIKNGCGVNVTANVLVDNVVTSMSELRKISKYSALTEDSFYVYVGNGTINGSESAWIDLTTGSSTFTVTATADPIYIWVADVPRMNSAILWNELNLHTTSKKIPLHIADFSITYNNITISNDGAVSCLDPSSRITMQTRILNSSNSPIRNLPVKFKLDDNIIQTVNTNSNGIATLSTTLPSEGGVYDLGIEVADTCNYIGIDNSQYSIVINDSTMDSCEEYL